MLLEVKNLSARYGPVMAMKNASFGVKTGEIVAMIGPNGAGKSTALRAVAGMLEAMDGTIDAGEVLFEGKNIRGLKTHELVGRGMVLVPEGRHVFASMTVLENLEMGGYTNKKAAAVADDIDAVLTLFPPLKARTRQKAGTLSTGEQQMLAIGRALMLRPKLLLADEPSLGLSPNYLELIFDKLKQINHQGTSILLVEQNASEALEIAHRAYVFSIGQIVLTDTSQNLLRSDEVKRTFLGG